MKFLHDHSMGLEQNFIYEMCMKLSCMKVHTFRNRMVTETEKKETLYKKKMNIINL